MAFLRFVLSSRHPDSGVEDGIFGVAYSLRDDVEVHLDDREQLRADLAWFEKNVPTNSTSRRRCSNSGRGGRAGSTTEFSIDSKIVPG